LGGIKDFRAAQREAAHSAATRAVSEYMVNPASPDIWATNEAYVNSLYDQTTNLLSQVPNQQIKPTNLEPIAKELLDQFPDVFKKFQNQRVESLIQDIARGVKPTTTIIPGAAPNYATFSGAPSTQVSIPTTLTWDEAWTLRKGLGEAWNQAKDALASKSTPVSKTEVSMLGKLLGGVSDDMEAWANSIGRTDISSAFQNANEAFKHYIVKYDLAARAYDAALKDNVSGLISPQIFRTELLKIAKSRDEGAIFGRGTDYTPFIADEAKELTGLANIMQVVKRAGQYTENQPTGNRMGPLIAAGVAESAAYRAGGLAGAIKLGVTGATVELTAKFLTTTAAGKRLCLAASTVPPVSGAMGTIIENIQRDLLRFSVGYGLFKHEGPPKVAEPAPEQGPLVTP
jgi:hypothetical protein